MIQELNIWVFAKSGQFIIAQFTSRGLHVYPELACRCLD